MTSHVYIPTGTQIPNATDFRSAAATSSRYRFREIPPEGLCGQWFGQSSVQEVNYRFGAGYVLNLAKTRLRICERYRPDNTTGTTVNVNWHQYLFIHNVPPIAHLRLQTQSGVVLVDIKNYNWFIRTVAPLLCTRTQANREGTMAPVEKLTSVSEWTASGYESQIQNDMEESYGEWTQLTGTQKRSRITTGYNTTTPGGPFFVTNRHGPNNPRILDIGNAFYSQPEAGVPTSATPLGFICNATMTMGGSSSTTISNMTGINTATKVEWDIPLSKLLPHTLCAALQDLYFGSDLLLTIGFEDYTKRGFTGLYGAAGLVQTRGCCLSNLSGVSDKYDATATTGAYFESRRDTGTDVYVPGFCARGAETEVLVTPVANYVTAFNDNRIFPGTCDAWQGQLMSTTKKVGSSADGESTATVTTNEAVVTSIVPRTVTGIELPAEGGDYNDVASAFGQTALFLVDETKETANLRTYYGPYKSSLYLATQDNMDLVNSVKQEIGTRGIRIPTQSVYELINSSSTSTAGSVAQAIARLNIARGAALLRWYNTNFYQPDRAAVDPDPTCPYGHNNNYAGILTRGYFTTINTVPLTDSAVSLWNQWIRQKDIIPESMISSFQQWLQMGGAYVEDFTSGFDLTRGTPEGGLPLANPIDIVIQQVQGYTIADGATISNAWFLVLLKYLSISPAGVTYEAV